jgi:hypothetical protein
MKYLIEIIVLNCILCPVFSQSNTNNKNLPEFIVTNEDFEYILDITIEEYNKCENKKKDYHFVISMGEEKKQAHSDVKNLYIRRSYYKDFVSSGYGFFYYNDYLFILQGQQLKDIFSKTNRVKIFRNKQEPISTFDPPRWLYYYWNKEFYFIYSSPCGG